MDETDENHSGFYTAPSSMRLNHQFNSLSQQLNPNNSYASSSENSSITESSSISSSNDESDYESDVEDDAMFFGNNRALQSVNDLNESYNESLHSNEEDDLITGVNDGLLGFSRVLAKEKDILQKELDSFKEENADLLNQINNLKLTSEKSSQRYEDIKDELLASENKLNENSKMIQKYENKIKSLCDDLSSSKSEIIKLNKTVKEISDNKEDILKSNEAQVRKLKSQIDELKNLNDSFEKEIGIQTEQILELKNQIKDLKSEINNLKVAKIDGNVNHDDKETSFIDDSILIDEFPQLNVKEFNEIQSDKLKMKIKQLNSYIRAIKDKNEKIDLDLKSYQKSEFIRKLSFDNSKEIDNSFDEMDVSIHFSDDDEQNESVLDTKNNNNTSFSANILPHNIDLNGSTPISSRKPSISTPTKPHYTLLVPKTILNNEFVFDKLDLNEYHTINLSETNITKLSLQPQNQLSYLNYNIVSNDFVNNLNKEIKELKNKVENPNLSALKEKHNLIDSSALDISRKAYEATCSMLEVKIEELQKKIDKPDVEYIKTKCHEKSFEMISSLELEKMKKSKENEVNQLKQKLSVLNTTFESPSKEYLLSHASDHKLVMVDEDQFKTTEETIKSLTNLLEERNNDLEFFKNNLTSLQNQLDSPSIEYLTEKAKLKKCTVITDDDLSNLKSTKTIFESRLNDANDYIEILLSTKSKLETDKTELENKILELENKCTKLHELNENPTLKYLELKSNSLDFLLLSRTSHQAEVSKSEFYSKQNENLISENKKLKQNIDKPEFNYISEKLLQLYNYRCISNEEFNSINNEKSDIALKLDTSNKLNQTLQEKIDSNVSEIGVLNSKIVLLENEIVNLTAKYETKQTSYNDLRNRLDSPSIGYLKEKCTNQDFVLLKTEEYKNLQTDIKFANEQLQKSNDELEHTKQLKISLEKEFRDNVNNTVAASLFDATKSELEDAKLEILSQENKLKELDFIKSELIDAKSQIGAQIIKLKDLDSTKLEMEDAKTQIETQNFKLKEFILTKSKLTNAKSEIENQKIELQQLDSTKAELETKLEEALNKIKLKESELDTTSAKVESLEIIKDKLKEKSAQLEDVETDKIQLQNEIHSLEGIREKLAESENKVVSLNEKLVNLNNTHEKPSVEYLTEKAIEQNKVLLTTEEKANLVTNLKEVSSKNVNLINSKETLENQVKEHETEINSLKINIQNLKRENTDLIKQLEEVKSLQNNPTVDYIKSKSTTLELVAIPIKQHSELKLNNQKQTSMIQTHKEEAIKLKKSLAEAKTAIDNPNLEFLEAKLKNFDCIPVKNKELEEFKLAKLEVDKHSKIQKQNAEKINILETKVAEKEKQIDELNHLKIEVSTKQAELDKTLSQLDQAVSLYNEPSVQYLISKLDSNSYKTMPAAEYTKIDEGIKGLEKKLEDCNKNLGEKSSLLESLKLELENTKVDYEAQIKLLKEEALNKQSSAPISAIKYTNENNIDSHSIAAVKSEDENTSELQVQHLKDLASKHGYAIISSQDFSTLIEYKNKFENVETKSFEELSEKIKQAEEKVHLLTKEIETLEKQVETDSTDKGGKSKNSKSKKELNTQLESKEKALKSESDILTELYDKLKKLKTIESPHINNVDAEEITTLKKELAQLQNKYESKNNEMELLKSKMNETSEPRVLADVLSLLGYSIRTPDKTHIQLGSIKLHKQNIKLKSVVDNKWYNSADGVFDIDRLISEEKYLLLNNQELKQKCDLMLKSMKTDEIKKLMINSDMVVLQKAEYQTLNEAINQKDDVPSTLTLQDLKKHADILDIVTMTKSEAENLKNSKITSSMLTDKANELGMVLFTKEEVQKLETKKPVTKENIVAKAKEFDLLCISKSRYVATSIARTPDVDHVKVVPNSYYSILVNSHAWFKNNKRSISTPTRPETITENDNTEVASFSPSNITQTFSTKDNQLHLPAKVDEADLMSLNSVATEISNKAEIRAAITKTVIGETLYKYYRKLGPLSNVSDTRHPKYFWIHAHTCTLYWAKSNPVLSPDGKKTIKSAKIYGITSVDDKNPLPVGLYYKTLVLKTSSKTMRITCPTRQIHNIWYNAIIYLLERSTDNLINDTNFENQYEQDFSLDRKTALERTQSQSVRQHSLRHSPSMRNNSFRINHSQSTRSMRSIR